MRIDKMHYRFISSVSEASVIQKKTVNSHDATSCHGSQSSTYLLHTHPGDDDNAIVDQNTVEFSQCKRERKVAQSHTCTAR